MHGLVTGKEGQEVEDERGRDADGIGGPNRIWQLFRVKRGGQVKNKRKKKPLLGVGKSLQEKSSTVQESKTNYKIKLNKKRVDKLLVPVKKKNESRGDLQDSGEHEAAPELFSMRRGTLSENSREQGENETFTKVQGTRGGGFRVASWKSCSCHRKRVGARIRMADTKESSCWGK